MPSTTLFDNVKEMTASVLNRLYISPFFLKIFGELVEGMEFFYSKDCYSITTYALLVG